MGKSVHDDVLDQSLNYVKTNGLRLCLCSQEPTTYTEAITTYKLADVDIDNTDYTGPANGDTSGRKVTINAQTGVTVDSSGTSNHAAIVDTVNSKLLLVTTHTGQALTAGNTVDIGSFKQEIADPT